MEPYRSSPGGCPVCSSPTREFNKRLVCDKCEGMMLAVDDYAGSLRDIDLSASEITVRDAKADTKKCPRCEQAMQSCTLAYGDSKIKERYLVCERDGLWVSSENMLAAYARISRAAAPGTSGLGAVAGALVDVAPGGTAAGAARGIRDAFGGNLVRHRKDRARPRVHSEFVSALRGKDMKCPACSGTLAFEGDRWACAGCKGVFVEDAALVAMVSEIRQAPWEMPELKGAAGARACPACGEKMVEEKLGTPTIDRCKAHGTWFDENELGAALLETGTGVPEASTGIRGWLKRLF